MLNMAETCLVTFVHLWKGWMGPWIVGDGFVGGAPAEHWVREAEAEVTGAAAVSGECMASWRASRHTAAAAAERAAMCDTWRRTHTSSVHERDAQVWSRVLTTGVTLSLLLLSFRMLGGCCHRHFNEQQLMMMMILILLSASLYVSKRGAYWDRLCRDVVGRLVVGWLVGWLSRACTVAKRCILGL